MALTLVTAPTEEPLTLDQAKGYLRLDGEEDDNEVTRLIKTAREHVEGQTHRGILTQTWDYFIDGGWPYRDGVPHIRMPLNPLASVSSLKYIDDSGTEQTLATDQYTVVARQHGSYIVPAYGVSWPTVRNVPNAITVRAVFGEATCPKQLERAIGLLVNHLYENREAVASRDVVSTPYALEAMLSPYRAGLPQ